MDLVDRCTGISRGPFPFTYLGCPIIHAKKRRSDYNELIKKVKNKLQTWKGKILSYGGKATLIYSVLQSIPIPTLSAIVPPKCVINELHKIFARFFWSNKETGRSKHWASWIDVCLTKEEGGLCLQNFGGIRRHPDDKIITTITSNHIPPQYNHNMFS